MRRVTAPQIARELGVPLATANKLLRRNSDWLSAGKLTKGRLTTYDAEVIELLRGLLGQPHRQVSKPESDWLSKFLRGRANA
jgi:hypothetical protein